MIDAPSCAAMEHVRELSVGIGPRPSGGEGERRAAEHIERVMRALAGEAKAEPFLSQTSGWRPFAITSALALISIPVFWFGTRGGALAAAALVIAALAAAVLQLLFLPNPLSLFVAKRPSRNVWTRIPAAVERRQLAVVTSHYDTHRTPLAYSSPFWVKVFRSLTAVGMGAFVFLAVIYLGAAALEPSEATLRALRAASLVPGAVHLLVLGLTLQADMTPYTPGANDNATGVGVLLDLLGRFAARPSANTEIWFVATGCEEAGLHGAAAFFAAHAGELRGAMQINIDNVGGKNCGPCYIDQEKMLATYRSDAKLLALADELRAERPELRCVRQSYQGAYTDGAIGVKHGLPTITFLGLGPDGWIPNLHQMSDVIEHVDPDTVARTADFIEALARQIDARLPHPL